ncbi:hypothetical protein ACVIHI_008514 [Bradyrhizobium sp. USDA 4524]|uniref:IS4/Tn5 family transposase DNA-binding protein n=1 Tax=unclassified Bradyrhizobium TaxID=2631580 RepID=UPI0020A212A5|nr:MULTISPECIES: transposase DNA-binding-containing protein [unclassified Bradyrhizobium]MCP1846025.1 hypothetical protein [Bradyrhizobium sp. USDA 4538]MCP1907341.1 hypothetical protein [Bradyrhizobium sp. USDA 4537]MCP1985127.1 hypothetical protein [Bradyrhizobium sp. USDA 4539]
MGLLKERAETRAQRLTTGIETWVDRETAGCKFKDERLGRRFCKLLAQVGSDMGQSIPLVCQDWANTKAAYRFLSNERVNEADILCGHFEATRGFQLPTFDVGFERGAAGEILNRQNLL